MPGESIQCRDLRVRLKTLLPVTQRNSYNSRRGPMEVPTTTNFPDARLPVVAILAIRFAECCRLVAAICLLMMSFGALQWMVGNASYVIRQEVTALEQLKTLGAEGESSSAQDFSGELGASASFMHAQVEVPVIGGLVSISVPPVAWLIFCVFATIAVVIFVVSVWRTVITMWVTARACAWTTFWASLGCLLQWIWTIVATVITVVITLLAVIFVLFNIVAFIAAL
jgi:hypothetical protein